MDSVRDDASGYPHWEFLGNNYDSKNKCTKKMKQKTFVKVN